MSAKRLDLLEGAPAEDHVVAARWAEALRFNERHCGSMRGPHSRMSQMRKHGALISTPPVTGAFHITGPPLFAALERRGLF
jgi:hypothetical protein